MAMSSRNAPLIESREATHRSTSDVNELLKKNLQCMARLSNNGSKHQLSIVGAGPKHITEQASRL